ncbi:DUF6008 family protein [Kineosporia succinea]|uniref:Uncharacterized protein n=1 Tax=Kineosporia succinea TaxID=84632 RepID=A0ABT9PAH7_9ACTN|nr:DUF6008 family protein [Kineosporia succinea]MDP9829689.1 hypothetical protein [Kineosporia succinea]
MSMDMGTTATGWDVLGAVGLLWWMIAMWAAVLVLYRAQRHGARPWQFWGATSVVVIGAVGQIGHAGEHFAQVGYWVGHPETKPWMTPWGNGLSNGFGSLVGSPAGKPSLGMEILHLVGNSIFLAGLAGVVVLTRPLVARGLGSRRWGRMGVWMQGIHGIEHLVLTLSIAFGAQKAIGLSTWFGLMDPGPGLWTYRIWWHFVANVIGSTIFVFALTHLWKERRELMTSYGVTSRPATAGAPAPQATPA